MRTNENGRTMLEMVAVIGLIGLLTVGGVAWYGSAISQMHANDLLAEARKRTVGAKASSGMRNRYTEGMFDKQAGGRAGLNGVTVYGYGIGDNKSGVEKRTVYGHSATLVPVGKLNNGRALTLGVCEALLNSVVPTDDDQNPPKIGDVLALYQGTEGECTKTRVDSCTLSKVDTGDEEETVETADVPDVVCIAIKS